MPDTCHLRVQITLLAPTARGPRTPRSAEFRTVLVSPGREHFAADVFPARALVPGGAAVNCEVRFESPEAAGYFPAGTQFDVWENGQKGYGTTLAVLT